MGSTKLVIEQKVLDSGIKKHNNDLILLSHNKSSIKCIILIINLTVDLPHSFNPQVQPRGSYSYVMVRRVPRCCSHRITYVCQC